jgi:hypothetical protein
MKIPRLVLIPSIIWLAGCTSVPPPLEAANVALVAVSSNSVAIARPKLVISKNQLTLDGYVTRQFGAFSTSRSHLDIVYFDASGHELRTETADFFPRDLGRSSSRFGTPKGRFKLPISDLPPEVVKIEVRAHDQRHQS